MKRKYQLVLLFSALFSFQTGFAQKPEQLLQQWSEKSPIEKTYLHFDRDNYLAGETAWFKAYLYSEYLPDTISTSLYVELLSQSSDLISRKTLPVVFGTTYGQIEIPDSLKTGTYIIRAYSPTMLNNDADFIYKRSFFIYGKKNNSVAANAFDKSIRLEFFPEGGNLVTGFSNTIAFKATNEDGMPATISGSIKSESGKELASFSSYHDGMGMFELTPEANGKYFAVLTSDAMAKKYSLPVPVDKGIALTIIPHPQGNYFEIHQQMGDPAFQASYMIGQMQHHVVFRQDFKAAKGEFQGVINTQKLNSGILQITIFNKDGFPLAERLCFVNNKEYIQPAELVTDTVNFSEKGKNRFNILMKDTVSGSLSVSIIDPEYSILPGRQENIFSRLLLSSDLKGYIHEPAYYFSADNDSVQTALDLVMMTNGWRRFKWSELTKNSTPKNDYKDLSFITLSGKVTLRDVKKPFAEKPLLVLIIGADSLRTFQMVNTDKQGNFRLDSMIFFGTSRILFSDTRGKKNQYIDVNMSADSLGRLFILPAMEKQPSINITLTSVSQSKLAYDYDAIAKASGTMLEAVVIKAKKKSLLEEVEEKYASGMFAGDANKTIDLVNNKDAETYLNIFDYLKSQVLGLSIVDPDFETSPMGVIPEYKLYYRQAANSSVSSMGPVPMALYLNEIETDAAVIATIPANQVAMVKVYGNFAGATGNGAGGVMAIYTKKDADITALTSSADMIKYRGYSVVREFYAPDYTPNKTPKNRADNRITLDWRPNIMINNVNPKIPLTFYNNDRTKKFKVIVEGMTNKGKMIFLEKIITPSDKKAF